MQIPAPWLKGPNLHNRCVAGSQPYSERAHVCALMDSSDPLALDWFRIFKLFVSNKDAASSSYSLQLMQKTTNLYLKGGKAMKM